MKIAVKSCNSTGKLSEIFQIVINLSKKFDPRNCFCNSRKSLENSGEKKNTVCLFKSKNIKKFITISSQFKS